MANANTRFALGSANLACATATTLINGASTVTYPSRPALFEDAQYPMSNLKVNDRGVIWRFPSATSGQRDVEWDAGADVNVSVVALHGLRWAAGQLDPTSCVVTYRRASEGYSQAGTWRAATTLVLTAGQRDAGLELAAPIRGRYFRFRFGNVAGGFGLANFYFGSLSHDLGMIYSPGSTDRLIRTRARTRTMMGAPIATELGDERRLFVLTFRAAQDDLKAILRSLARATAPTTYLPAVGEIFQVILLNDEHELSHAWGHPNLWDTSLELESLP